MHDTGQAVNGIEKPIVIKVMDDCEPNKHEIQLLEKLSKCAELTTIAKIIDKGSIKRSQETRMFVVIERLGPSIRDFMENIKMKLKLKDIVKLGIGMIGCV